MVAFESENSPSMFASVYYIFENYGWYILIASVVAAIVYSKKLKPHVEKYKQYKFEQEYAAKYHKNPDLLSAHVDGQQRWANKLQEKYNKQTEKYQNKLKEKEERKRQELIDKYGTADGFVLGGRREQKEDDNKAKKNTLKPDYNPLMGPGSSSRYRPPRRSACGGGGCGR